MNRFQKSTLAILTSLTTSWGCTLIKTVNSRTASAVESDLGDLILHYETSTEQNFQEIKTILEETTFFDDLAAELNSSYSFPQNINVRFLECGEENAFYDPETVEINMCYELIYKYADIFLEEYEGDYEDEIILAGYFTFLHELGHALVDLYQLPIIVREEDVVDSFATFLLLQTGEDDAVIAGIEQFDVDAAEDEEFGDLPFWGEHSLSVQRVYNITCLVYGSDPQAYADFVDDGFLPPERAETCMDEYEQVVVGWETLLTDFTK